MLSDYIKPTLLEAIFNDGALGNTLWAILHTGQNTGDRVMHPASSVATYASYAPVALPADDTSLFSVVADELRLVETIDFPTSTGTPNNDLTYLSICDGVTSSDNVLLVAPIKMSGSWFMMTRSGPGAANSGGSQQDTTGAGGAGPVTNTKYRAYKHINSPEWSSSGSAPNTFPDGAKWGRSNGAGVGETQGGNAINHTGTPFSFVYFGHVVQDAIVLSGTTPVVGSYAMTGRPLLKLY